MPNDDRICPISVTFTLSGSPGVPGFLFSPGAPVLNQPNVTVIFTFSPGSSSGVAFIGFRSDDKLHQLLRPVIEPGRILLVDIDSRIEFIKYTIGVMFEGNEYWSDPQIINNPKLMI